MNPTTSLQGHRLSRRWGKTVHLFDGVPALPREFPCPLSCCQTQRAESPPMVSPWQSCQMQCSGWQTLTQKAMAAGGTLLDGFRSPEEQVKDRAQNRVPRAEGHREAHKPRGVSFVPAGPSTSSPLSAGAPDTEPRAECHRPYGHLRWPQPTAPSWMHPLCLQALVLTCQPCSLQRWRRSQQASRGVDGGILSPTNRLAKGRYLKHRTGSGKWGKKHVMLYSPLTLSVPHVLHTLQ